MLGGARTVARPVGNLISVKALQYLTAKFILAMRGEPQLVRPGGQAPSRSTDRFPTDSPPPSRPTRRRPRRPPQTGWEITLPSLRLTRPTGVDRQPALGVKQRAGHLDRMERRRAALLRRRTGGRSDPPPLGLEVFDLGPFRGEARGRHMHGIARDLQWSAALRIAPARSAVAEILELARDRRNARIEHIPGDAARLAQHVRGLLGIAARIHRRSGGLRC